MNKSHHLFICAALLIGGLWSQVQAEPVDFTLKDLDGEPVSLSDFRGRWVVINFWASWCSPCVRELPELVLYQQRNPDVQVIGINFEETSSDESRGFLAQFDMNFPNLKIAKKPLVPFEPLEGLPTTAIVNPAGEMVERHMGPVTANHLQAIIDRHRK
ncbi:MAG: TlpA disulfide reductase family protein [Sedimenticolaceae bacterium]